MRPFGVTGLATFLAVALGWPGSSPAAEFSLLPALPTELASERLLLDAAVDGQRVLVGGEQGNILYSEDNGATWVQADVPVSLAVTSVTFAGDSRAWATAHDGYLLASRDKGATWEVKLTGSDVAALSVSALEGQVEALRAVLGEASPEAREDAEWALDDAEFALEEARIAIDEGMTSPLLESWFLNDQVGYVLGAYGVFLRTDDGGDTWVSHADRLINPDSYHLYGIARSTSGTLVLAGEAGTLLRSLDDGATWERVESPYAGSFFGAVGPADGSLLVFGLRGNVFRSTDEGASWQFVDTGDKRTLMGGTAGADGSIVLAGAGGAVLRSTEDGSTFRSVDVGNSRVFSGVTQTADGRYLLVGFGGVFQLPGAADE